MTSAAIFGSKAG